MQELFFPYTILFVPAPPRPYLEVEISNKFPNEKSKKLQIPCMLDTGADMNLLPAFVCDVLGHDLKSGDGPIKYHGVGNKRRNAYKHSNIVKILGPDGDVVYNDEMTFYISEDWESLTGLFGHNEFFKKFPGFFDSDRGYFTLFID